MIDFYKPHRIDIVLDNECNLSCIGCIRARNIKTDNTDYLKFVNKIISQSLYNEYSIHFTGGEPLLQWKTLSSIILTLKNIKKIYRLAYTLILQ